MKGFWNVLKHKYFRLAATIMIVFLPLVLFMNQQQQNSRGRADVSTSLSFSPSTTIQAPVLKKVGDNFYLDAVLNPEKNLVSLVKMDILYDATKVGLSQNNPLVVNEAMFPQVIEGPVYSPGRIQVVLSVGPDLSKAVGTQSRVLTLNFVAKGATNQTIVSFGPKTEIFSVAPNDQSGENVLSTTSPAFIKISKTTGKSGGGKVKPPR